MNPSFQNQSREELELADILRQENPSLLAVLAFSHEVLTKCEEWNWNPTLMAFLHRPSSLAALIQLVTTKPPAIPDGVQVQYNLAVLACDILQSNPTFPPLIWGNPELLTLLFNYFRDAPVPLDHPLVDSACRLINTLFFRAGRQQHSVLLFQDGETSNGDELMSFLQESPRDKDVIAWLLKHIGSQPVTDLFYNIIVGAGRLRREIAAWLLNGHFVEGLIEQLAKDEDADTQVGVSRLIGKLMAHYRREDKNNDDQVYEAFILPSTLALVFESVLGMETNPSSTSRLIQGLSVVQSLVGLKPLPAPPLKWKDHLTHKSINRHIELPPEADSVILTGFEALHRFLVQEPNNDLVLTSGPVPQRLGLGRLALLKFYAQILSLRRVSYINKFLELGSLKVTMNLFWRSSNRNNNMMHQAVEAILTQIILGNEENGALEFLVCHDNLLESILVRFEEKGCGFRAHVARLATILASVSTSGWQGRLFDRFASSEEGQQTCLTFQSFCWSAVSAYNELQGRALGGEMPKRSKRRRSSPPPPPPPPPPRKEQVPVAMVLPSPPIKPPRRVRVVEDADAEIDLDDLLSEEEDEGTYTRDLPPNDIVDPGSFLDIELNDGSDGNGMDLNGFELLCSQRNGGRLEGICNVEEAQFSWDHDYSFDGNGECGTTQGENGASSFEVVLANDGSTRQSSFAELAAMGWVMDPSDSEGFQLLCQTTGAGSEEQGFQTFQTGETFDFGNETAEEVPLSPQLRVEGDQQSSSWNLSLAIPLPTEEEAMEVDDDDE